MLQPPGSSSGRQTARNRRKTQESPEDILRSLSRVPCNKKCADCTTKLPQCVNLTVGTFCCMACSGVLRELNHRVKGLGASTFSVEEAARMKETSNDKVNALYLARYDPSKERLRAPQDNFDQQLLRVWIRRKYHDKAWYSESGSSTQPGPTRVEIPPKKSAPAPAVDLLGFDAPAPAPPPAVPAATANGNAGWDAFGGSTANKNSFAATFPSQQQQQPQPQQQGAFANFNQQQQQPPPSQQPQQQQTPQQSGFANFNQQQPPQQQQFGNFNQQQQPPQQQQQQFGNFNQQQQPPQQQEFGNFNQQQQQQPQPQPGQQQQFGNFNQRPPQQGFGNFNQQQQQQPPQQQQQPQPPQLQFGNINQQPQQPQKQQGFGNFNQQPATQQPPLQQQQPLSSDPYSMSPEELSNYEQTFPQYEKDGYVYGGEAVQLFSQMGLPQDKLRDIWTMVDIPVDNRLDKIEFCMAMHLISCAAKKNLALPSALPASLQALKQHPVPASPGAPTQQGFGAFPSPQGVQQPQQRVGTVTAAPPQMQQPPQPQMAPTGGPAPVQNAAAPAVPQQPPPIGVTAPAAQAPPTTTVQQEPSMGVSPALSQQGFAPQPISNDAPPRTDSVVSQAGSDANSRKNAFDAFSELSLAPPEEATSDAAPPSSSNAGGVSKYSKGQSVVYTDSKKDISMAKIVKVHFDDDLEPFYTIDLIASGKEKQTDDAHLSELPEPSPIAKQIHDMLLSFSEEKLQQVHKYMEQLQNGGSVSNGCTPSPPVPATMSSAAPAAPVSDPASTVPAPAPAPPAAAPVPAAMPAPPPAAPTPMPAPTPAAPAPITASTTAAPAPVPVPTAVAPAPVTPAAPVAAPTTAPAPVAPVSPTRPPSMANGLQIPSPAATSGGMNIPSPAAGMSMIPSPTGGAHHSNTMVVGPPTAMAQGPPAMPPFPAPPLVNQPSTGSAQASVPPQAPHPTPQPQPSQQQAPPVASQGNPFDSPMSPKGNPFDMY